MFQALVYLLSEHENKLTVFKIRGLQLHTRLCILPVHEHPPVNNRLPVCERPPVSEQLPVYVNGCQFGSKASEFTFLLFTFTNDFQAFFSVP